MTRHATHANFFHATMHLSVQRNYHFRKWPREEVSFTFSEQTQQLVKSARKGLQHNMLKAKEIFVISVLFIQIPYCLCMGDSCNLTSTSVGAKAEKKSF